MEFAQEQNRSQSINIGFICNNLKWWYFDEYAKIINKTLNLKVKALGNIQFSTVNASFEDKLRFDEEWHLGDWLYCIGTIDRLWAKSEFISPIQSIHLTIELWITEHNKDQYSLTAKEGQTIKIHGFIWTVKDIFVVQHHERLFEHTLKDQEVDRKRHKRIVTAW